MRSCTLIALLVSSLALSSSACSGQALDVGSTDAGSDGTKDGSDIIFITADGGSGSGKSGFDQADAGSDAPSVATAKAVCAQNGGDFATTGDDTQTPAGITAKLVGRWYSCDAVVPSAMRTTPAISFAADGTWTRWQDDGAGGVQPVGGVDGAGTWKIFGQNGAFFSPTDTTPGTYPYIYIVNSTGGESPTAMTFIDSPRLLFAAEATSGLRTFLVPLP